MCDTEHLACVPVLPHAHRTPNACRGVVSLKLLFSENLWVDFFFPFFSPYIVNCFRGTPVLLVFSPQKVFLSSLPLALRGQENLDALGKPVSKWPSAGEHAAPFPFTAAHYGMSSNLGSFLGCLFLRVSLQRVGAWRRSCVP